MTPQRIQQRRTKGWRKPEGAVAVGRGTKWGNPYDWHELVDKDGLTPTEAREAVAEMYRTAVVMNDWPDRIPEAHVIRAELRGRDLMCWCPLDQPCHADVLLELANGDPR